MAARGRAWWVAAVACARVGHAITLSREAPMPAGGSAVATVTTADGALLFGVDRGGLTVQRRDASGALVPGSFRGIAAAGCRERLSNDEAPAVMAAAYDGGVWVVWGDWNRAHELVTARGMRFADDGTPMDRAPVTLAPESLVRPSDIACAGDQCMVLFGASFVRVGADGRVLDAARRPLDPRGVGNSVSRVAPVSDGWVVAWPTLEATNEVRVVRVSRDGAPIDATPMAVSTDGRRHTSMALGSNGRAALLSWTSDGDSTTPTRRYVERIEGVRAARAAPSPFDPPFAATTVLWNGADWTLLGRSGDGTRVTRVSADGTATLATFDRPDVWVAARGAASGFVAVRAVSGLSQTFQRLDPNGSLVGDDPLPVFRFEHDAHVDTDGGDFFVGWVLGDDVPVLNRVSPSGVVREVAGSTAAPWVGPTVPLAAWAMLHDGARASLWAARPRTPSGSDLESVTVDLTTRRFGARTTWPGLGPVTSTARVGEDRIVVASGRAQRVDRGYHARWEDWTTLRDGQSCSVADDGTSTRYACLASGLTPDSTRVAMGRIDRDGRLVDVTAEALALPGVAFEGVQLAYGAGAFALLWLDRDRGVWCAPLAPDGSVAAARATRLDDGAPWPAYAPRHASLSFNGARFVAVWNADDRGHIVAARLAPDATLLDATPRVVVSSPEYQPSFAATSNAVGDTFVAWEGSNPDVGAWQVQGATFHDDLPWPTADAGVDGGADARADVTGDATIADVTGDATIAPDAAADDPVAADVAGDATGDVDATGARRGATTTGGCACDVGACVATRVPWWVAGVAALGRRRRRRAARRG